MEQRMGDKEQTLDRRHRTLDKAREKGTGEKTWFKIPIKKNFRVCSANE
jgi:hypothetical protein